VPLEYQGYIPIIKKIEDGLPNKDELSRYKAVMVWTHKAIEEPHLFEEWIKLLVTQKIKVLFMGSFGVRDITEICKILNITKLENKAELLDKQIIAYKDNSLEFESNIVLDYDSQLLQPENGKKYLSIMNAKGQEFVPIAKTSWGGYALSAYMSNDFGEDSLWVINPFVLFKEILELEDIPVPDPTTQNGRRLLFAHVDGDGSMNRVEFDARQYSIGMMYEKIFKKYSIPQSFSIVEAEINKEGLYPKDSDALESYAYKIYQLNNIEPATHTFTHPFIWGEIKDGDLDEKYRLKLKGYSFSLDREIQGSLDYINTTLDSKTKAKSVYWTGDCLPGEEVLEYTYKNNILNMNGGDTIITNDKPWLSLVAPYGLKRGEYYQVYTGAQNENVYTNEWHGPFWGYKKVIQTFELTNKPRRLKPIDIYYHLYAASKRASLSALEEVYEWALSQETMPIYTSEYIPKVMEFYDLSMYKVGNGWRFEGMQELKTLRLDASNTKVRYSDSQTVLGEKKEGNSTYIHLNTHADDIELEFGEEGDENHLIDTNAEVLSYKRVQEAVSFALKGHVNIVLNYHLKEGCELKTSAKVLQRRQSGRDVFLKFDAKETDVLIRCP
jgi:polysaccharide biosynthesis protein PelA